MIPLDAKTISKIKRKHRLWQRFIETKEDQKFKEYAKVRNQVKKEVKAAKKKMEMEIALSVKKDPKKFWKYANSKRKFKTGIADLELVTENGTTMAKNDADKAEMLSNFFQSVYTEEPTGAVPTAPHINIMHPFQDYVFSEKQVQELLQKLDPNKSPGPDKIHPKLLKELAEQLSDPLTNFFNSSFRNGHVPTAWKQANITAIFKKGDKSKPNNYRPVSLTSILSKLMEKLIRKMLVDHMKENQLFSDKQFGFISGRSTSLQLIKVMDHWTKILDEGGEIDVIYMDYMKAFDTVPHKRLISKLDSYGISPGVVI